MANYSREAKLVAWYHQPKPQCVCITVKETRCVMSARYVQVGRDDVKLCKTHRDMLPDTQFKEIRPSRVDVRSSDTVGGLRLFEG